MPRNVFTQNACKALAGLLANNDRYAYGFRKEPLDNAKGSLKVHTEQILARANSLEAKRLAMQGIHQLRYKYKSMFQRMSFQFTKVGQLEWYNILSRDETVRDLAAPISKALGNAQLKAMAHTDELNLSSSLLRGLRKAIMPKNGLSDQYAYLGFALGNSEAIMATEKIANRTQRVVALKAALLDHSRAEHIDAFTFGDKPLDRDTAKTQLAHFLSKQNDLHLDDMAKLYYRAGRLRNDYKEWWVNDFAKREGRAPTQKELYDEVGGTFGAWMPRVWQEEAKTGWVHDLMASADGVLDFDATGVSAEGGRIPFAQLMRKMTKVSNSYPLIKLTEDTAFPTYDILRAPKGLVVGTGSRFKTISTKTDMFKELFPGLSEAQRASAPTILAHLASAANDGVMMRAIPAKVRDAFYQHRQGALGFQQSFLESMGAYINAGSRMKHFGPLFGPNGEVSKVLATVSQANPPLAHSMSEWFDNLMQRTGYIDRDLPSMMHPLARTTAQAIFALNPAPALMNLSSILLQGIPFAVSDGMVAGTKDIFHAVSMLATKEKHRLFSAMFDEAHLGGASAYGYSVGHGKIAALLERFDDARKIGDYKTAYLALRDSGVSASEFLTFTEGSVVRPFMASVGLARFYRMNPGLTFGETLSGEAGAEAMRSMLLYIDQATTIAGGVNAMPMISKLRGLPVIGSLASMLTTTPTNIADIFFRDLRLIMDPTSVTGQRAPATRRLFMQAAMGTVLAGPFWFLPMFRDADTDEDKHNVLTFAEQMESKWSLAGIMNTEFADRLNPVLGVTQRFAPEKNPLSALMFGPLARPISDVYGTATGDPASTRRFLGMFSGIADLPPDTILPTSLQYLLPAGVAFERLGKVMVAFALPSDPSGAYHIGGKRVGIDIPVPTPEGNRVDANGRPYIGPSNSVMGAARSYLFGGQALDEAQIAAEGRRSEKVANRQSTAEQDVRRHILSGNLDAALDVLTDNADLPLEITDNELEREKINEMLLPQARAVYSGPEAPSMKRFIEAYQAIGTGNLSATRKKNESHIVMAGLLRWGGR